MYMHGHFNNNNNNNNNNNILCISYTTRPHDLYNPYTPQRRGMSDIYSIASYRYFGGTFRMADLASGWFCSNADDFMKKTYGFSK